MRILVVGSGGREHAICWRLAQSSTVTKIFCAPGNGGTSNIATNIPLAVRAIPELAQFAEEEQIDLTIVGPEEPLSLGIVNYFNERGLPIFGPTKQAAQLESSKSFAKEVMLAAGVRTARGQVFDSLEEAEEYVRLHGAPIVIKADGLAAGKGVVVAGSIDEALLALRDFMGSKTLGSAGSRVVIEECLHGAEASVIAVVSGDTVRPFVVSQDYKRLLDDNKGPNTGGMGAISPTPVLSEARLQECIDEIFLPTIRELRKRSIEYTGFLYAGAMVQPDGSISVLEFNCRLGDPETQVLMMRMESDLAALLRDALTGGLREAELKFKSDAAVCIVLASEGYPGKVRDGVSITGVTPATSEAVVFHAGTSSDAGRLLSSGGRILCVTARGESVQIAAQKAYGIAEKVTLPGGQYRRDIGGGTA